MEEALSSSSGPLLASLSAFWLRLSEKASSLGRRTDVSWKCSRGCDGLCWVNIHLKVKVRPQLWVSHLLCPVSPPRTCFAKSVSPAEFPPLTYRTMPLPSSRFFFSPRGEDKLNSGWCVGEIGGGT